jgi:hypothetical protein
LGEAIATGRFVVFDKVYATQKRQAVLFFDVYEIKTYYEALLEQGVYGVAFASCKSVCFI